MLDVDAQMRELADEKRRLWNRIQEIQRLETRHPRLTDERIAELRWDRTGLRCSRGSGEIDQLTWDEMLSLLDEVAAWRHYKLTDEEKTALRRLADGLTDEHSTALAVLRRIGK